MTQELYYSHPYQRTFEAQVISCEERKQGGFWTVLTQTVFYPEGGGQPGDTGVLRLDDGREIAVTDCHTAAGRPAHLTEEYIAPGTFVTGEIHWAQRFNRMQNHTGEHIISGLLHKHFGAENVGFHMGEEMVQIDFDREFTQEQLSFAERLANEAVWENLPVKAVVYEHGVPPEEIYRSKKELTGSVRLVTVPECDKCACCGVHVANTGEIGVIRLLRWERYKGGMRIWMVSGADALKQFRLHSGQVYQAMGLLSLKPEQVAEGIARLKGESEQKQQTSNRWRTAYFSLVTKTLCKECPPYVICTEEGLTPEEVRLLAVMLAEQTPLGVVLSPLAGAEPKTLIGIASVKEQAVVLMNGLKERLLVKGGGKPAFAQGTVEGASGEGLKVLLEDLLRG